MAAGCLSAGKDNTYNLLLSFGSVLAFLESDFLFAIGIREKSFDFFLRLTVYFTLKMY